MSKADLVRIFCWRVLIQHTADRDPVCAGSTYYTVRVNVLRTIHRGTVEGKVPEYN